MYVCASVLRIISSFFFFFFLTFWPCLRHWFFDLCMWSKWTSKHISIWISGQNNDTDSNDDEEDEDGKFPNLTHSTATQKKSLLLIFSPTVLYPIPSSIRFDSCVSFVFGLIETKSRIDILPKIRIACCLCDIFSHSHTDKLCLPMLLTG